MIISKIQDSISQYFRIRGLTLYFVQAPLWVAIPVHLFRGRASAVFFDLLLLAALFYAAKVTREYFRTPFPLVDRRALAAGCLGLAVMIFFLGTLRRPPALSFLMGILAVAGYVLTYFGQGEKSETAEKPPVELPTLKRKTPKIAENGAEHDIPAHLPPTLRQMLLNGYQTIDILEKNAAALSLLRHEKRLGLKLNRSAKKAREIMQQIEHSPEQIRAARAFLVVHLTELSKISQQYLLDVDRPNHDEQRKNFYHLLCESEEAFTAHHLKLTTQQQEQLDIQIQVLRDQLKQGNSHD